MKLKKMSEDEKNNEQPDKIFKIIEEILNFDKKNTKTIKRWLKNTNATPNA